MNRPLALALCLLILGLQSSQQDDRKPLAVNKMQPIEKKISMHLKKTTLRLTLKRIGQTTGVQLVFDDELVKSKIRVSKKFKQKTATEILSRILRDFGLAYIVKSGSTIVIIRKTRDKHPAGRRGDKVWKAQLRRVPFLQFRDVDLNGV